MSWQLHGQSVGFRTLAQLGCFSVGVILSVGLSAVHETTVNFLFSGVLAVLQVYTEWAGNS